VPTITSSPDLNENRRRAHARACVNAQYPDCLDHGRVAGTHRVCRVARIRPLSTTQIFGAIFTRMSMSCFDKTTVICCFSQKRAHLVDQAPRSSCPGSGRLIQQAHRGSSTSAARYRSSFWSSMRQRRRDVCRACRRGQAAPWVRAGGRVRERKRRCRTGRARVAQTSAIIVCSPEARKVSRLDTRPIPWRTISGGVRPAYRRH